MKITKPFFCTAKVTIFLFIANLFFITYAHSNSLEYINIVSARQEYLVKPIFDEFTKDTNIQVNYIFADSTEDILNVIKEQQEKSEVDLFLFVEASDLYKAQQQGFLQPIYSEILDKNIPTNLKDPSRQWFGFSMYARCLIYNTQKVNPEYLKDYESLTDEIWYKKLALRSSKNIYNISMVAMMIAHYGYDTTKIILQGWVKNLAKEPFESDVDVIKSIINNEANIGIINGYYLAEMLKKDPSLPLKILWLGNDNNEVHINISGMGVMRYAKRKENAIKLLEWLSSSKGQQLFANINMEYPVNKDVLPHPLLQKWGSFKSSKINVRKAGELQTLAIKLTQEIGYE